MTDKNTINDGKNISIIAHLLIIGWVIALFMNKEAKNKFSGFYIKQTLGIHIIFFMLAIIVGYFNNWMIASSFSFFYFIFWVYSFLGAVQGEYHLIPYIGNKFQIWFNKISA